MKERAAMYLATLLVTQCGYVAGSEAGGNPQTIEDLKRLDLDELMNVRVTTVSRQESTVGESPAAIYVITQEDIRRSGATTIPELFRRVPGMNVARVDANKWAVSARGFNDRFANKLLVQIDGRTVYSSIFSGVFWDTVDYPLEDIERIEVIRGPGASTWGANAVNGVINILTKSASTTRGALLSGGGGTEEQGFGMLRYGGLKDRVDYRIYGKGFVRDTSFGTTPAPFDDWSGLRAGFRSDWLAGDTKNLTLQGDYARSDAARIDFRPQPLSPFVYTNAEREISNGANLLARWSRPPDRGGPGWALQAYWDHLDRRSTGEILVFNMDTLDVDVQHESTVAERHRVVWGLGYRATAADLTDSRLDGFILAWDPHHRLLHTANAFAQDQISVVANRLSVTVGAKLERNSLTGFEVQPNGRLLWTPTISQTIWSAVSRAVRTPTLFEDQRSVTQTPASPQPGVTVFPRIVANPDLSPEVVVAYELGYRRQPTRTSSVDLAVFYNVYDDLKVFAPAGSTTAGAPAGTSFRLSTHQNQMQGESHGLELSSRWRPRNRWQLYGAYSLLRMDLRAGADLPSMIQTMSEAAERQSPQHQVYLQSSLNLPGDTEIDVTGRFVDRLTGFPQPVEDYTSIDLRAGWTLHTKIGVEVVGQNLLDSHHLEVGGSVLAGPLHEVQRSIYGKLSIAW